MADLARLAERRLYCPACTNARDLGGLGTLDGGRTRRGAVVRTDCPCRLTDGGWGALVAHGVRTIIDLRDPEEHAREPYAPPNAPVDGAEIDLLSLPLRCTGPEVDPLFGAAETLEEAYVITVDYCQANVAAVLRAVAQARPGGIVIHCQSGRDRTAIVVALLLALAGVPADTIGADYVASQCELWPRWEAAMAVALADPKTANAPDALEAVRRQKPLLDAATMLTLLQHLDDRYGGAAGYMATVGLTEADRAALVERLLERPAETARQ
ncbi:MAG: tyrosine-protein phosphatase [Anaerolineae bacterium]